jgi:hypothetical protein
MMTVVDRLIVSVEHRFPFLFINRAQKGATRVVSESIVECEHAFGDILSVLSDPL